MGVSKAAIIILNKNPLAKRLKNKLQGITLKEHNKNKTVNVSMN